jgi:hypothetical protein
MMYPEAISVLGLIVSGIIFYWYASKVNQEKLTLDNFMVSSDQSLTKGQYSSTWAASSFSLGMTVVFLLGACKQYGIFIIVSPITFVAGHIFFTWAVKNSNLDVRNCRTISDICYIIYPSKCVSRIITGLTMGSYIMLLFLELYVATVLLTIFLGDSIALKGFMFLGIGIIALLYVRLGGYKAIVKTDKWQLTMMLLSVVAILVYGLMIPALNSKGVSEILQGMVNYTADPVSMVTMMIWLAAINAVYPFAQLANIQRLTATKCKQTSFKGVLHGSWKLLVLFLFTIFGFLLIHGKGYNMHNINDFLMLVRNGDSFASYILFPLLTTGFASMIFSSTDICIIAISYALADSNTFQKQLSNMKEKTLRKTLTIFIITLLVMLTIIYWLQFSGLQEWLMPVIYTTCGQLAILTPIPIYAVLKLTKQKKLEPIKVNKKNTFIIFNSILFAWFLLFLGAYLSKTLGQEYWSLASMPVGGILVFMSILIAKSLENTTFSAKKVSILGKGLR